MAYDYDILVIGGGPAGYAGAIRAAQLKKRVLCIERDKLGGICLNWGCIPTKALLSNAHLVELIKTHGKRFGYNGQGDWDFGQMIGRSRNIAGQLNKGIEGLFRKYKVASKFGVAKVIAPHEVQVGDEKVTAESIVTKVTVVEMLDRIVPGEDEEISAALKKILSEKGLNILTNSKTTKVEKNAKGVMAEIEAPSGKTTIEADIMLVAIGVLGNVEGLFADTVKVEIVKNHIQVDPKNGYVTSVPGIYAVGDVIGPPWLAHVAHFEAVCCVETLCGVSDRTVDYSTIPGCTYTEPGVASVGMTEKAARAAGHEVRIGKFPFQFSGRALAAGETEGFVKLVFDAKYGELLGAHLIGAMATEMISELVMAKKLEATEEEIHHIMHPHPTFSESIMEAAGQGLGESVNI